MGRKEKKDTGRYVVFDQFHWNDPDHLEYVFGGWEYALSNYRFLKAAHPDKTLGLTSVENYEKIKEGTRPTPCSHCGRQEN